jgi:uncharacterized protein YbjT (DUF2867 family)
MFAMEAKMQGKDTKAPILVTGGTGKTGRRLAERLVAKGAAVRIGSRSASPAFDWHDERTWPAALAGARAVYVAYHPDIAAAGALEIVTAFFTEVRRQGIDRIVLLSGRGEPEAEAAEDALKVSGADWTILRCSWFAQNFDEGFFLDGIRSGVLALPARPIPEPFVDVEDIADVAAAAFTEPGHSGRLYEISGPRALTFSQAVDEIAQATGRDVHFRETPVEPFMTEALQYGVAKEEVDLVAYLFGTILDGRNSRPVDGVREALGRPAADFSDYVRRVAATGVWRNQ